MPPRLPRAIQAQVEAADAILTPQAPAAPPVTDPPPAPPPSDPTPPAPTQPPAPAAAAPAAPVTEDTWAQRYASLQGQFRHLNETIQQQATTIRQLQATPQAPAPTPAPTPAPKPAVDPKDVEAFGLDMVSMVQRVADQYIAGLTPQIESRFAALDEQIQNLSRTVQGTTQTVASSAEDRFFEQLEQKIHARYPGVDWEKVNVAPEFLAFLNEKDPIYGLTRSAALKNAQDHFDAPRAANVFIAFLDTIPKAAPAPSESPTPRGAGTPPPAPVPQKPLVKESAYVAFLDDCRRGRYRGREQEAAQLEAQFNAALAEGRIVIGQ